MVFGKILLDELRRIRRAHRLRHHLHLRPGSSSRQAMEITRDKLQPRIVKRRPAVVGERDPAVEIGRLVVAADGQHVIRVPGKIARQVRGFHLLLARARIFKRHQERGTLKEVRGDLGKAIALGVEAGHNVVADFPHGTVVVGQQRGLDLFPLRRAVLLIRADKRDFAPHVLVQELRRFKQVVFVVLLDNADLVGLVQRAEMDGCGIHGRSNVHELQAQRSGGQRELAHIAHQRDIRVIDRHRQIGLIVQRGRGVFARNMWRATRAAFRRRECVVAADRRIERRGGSHQEECGSSDAKKPPALHFQGIVHGLTSS